MAAGRKRRAARARKGGRPPAKRPKSKVCERSGKLGYRSQEDAVAAMAQFSRSEHFRGQRTYHCSSCGRWHTTSQV